ncbi:thiamine pyrophosphate-binding protein [Candidatus Woesearchaeota archaeon]|nr:thiamine pyrophosphate-binding protein [Candidatus Woesearchaeota archaeon]
MSLLEETLQIPRGFDVPRVYNSSTRNGKTGNTLLLDNFLGWGANLFFLTNGGGAVHVHEHVRPFTSLADLVTGYPIGYVVNETTAAYAALGYSLASGRIGICSFTTGGAADLVGPAIIDAKMHNIPVIFLGALSASTAGNNAPLQDTTINGFNTVEAMKARLGDGCQVIDKASAIESVLYHARERLADSKPVVVLYHSDILSQRVPWFQVPWEDKPQQVDELTLENLISNFPHQTNGRRVVIFVGEEAARYKGIQELTTTLARMLKAPTIYTPTGVSAVSQENEFSAGHVMLGHNDYSFKLWRSLKPEETVIVVGPEPHEYSTNQEKLGANAVVITNYKDPYGSVNGSFRHRVAGNYTHIRGPIDVVLRNMIQRLSGMHLVRPNVEIPRDLNESQYQAPPEEFTNMQVFYRSLARHIPKPAIYIGDVCRGYKDPQNSLQRPVEGLKFLYVHQGSLMGQGAGQALGVKLALPNHYVCLVTGDGCFEYSGAALGRMANQNLLFIVLHDGTHGLVSWGLSKIKPYLPNSRKLTDVPSNDYVMMAKAQGWEAYDLRPDLSNMGELMRRFASLKGRSMLMRVPVFPDDDLGQNPRLYGLGRQGQANL